MDAETKQGVPESTKCARCWKAPEACLCAELPSISAKTRLLILQHPQESRNPLGTARLASLAVKGAVHRVGLSWRSLGHALGSEADASDWGVLYLGTRENGKSAQPSKPLTVLGRAGRPIPAKLKGLVILDGNWKQSKTLWWRNPWLNRLKRVVLNPDTPSAFQRLSRQPRKQCLCTLESVRYALAALEGPSAKPELLDELLKKHIERIEVTLPSTRKRPEGARRRPEPSEPPRPAAH